MKKQWIKRKDGECEATILARSGDQLLVTARWGKGRGERTNTLYLECDDFEERYSRLPAEFSYAAA